MQDDVSDEATDLIMQVRHRIRRCIQTHNICDGPHHAVTAHCTTAHGAVQRPTAQTLKTHTLWAAHCPACCVCTVGLSLVSSLPVIHLRCSSWSSALRPGSARTAPTRSRRIRFSRASTSKLSSTSLRCAPVAAAQRPRRSSAAVTLTQKA